MFLKKNKSDRLHMYVVCRVDADRGLIARIKLDLSVSGSDDKNQNLFIICFTY